MDNDDDLEVDIEWVSKIGNEKKSTVEYSQVVVEELDNQQHAAVFVMGGTISFTMFVITGIIVLIYKLIADINDSIFSWMDQTTTIIKIIDYFLGVFKIMACAPIFMTGVAAAYCGIYRFYKYAMIFGLSNLLSIMFFFTVNLISSCFSSIFGMTSLVNVKYTIDYISEVIVVIEILMVVLSIFYCVPCFLCGMNLVKSLKQLQEVHSTVKTTE